MSPTTRPDPAATASDASGVRASGPATVTQTSGNTAYTTAQNLGTIASPLQVNASLASGQDVRWFQFTLPTAATANTKITLTFTGASGAVRAALYADPAHKGAIVYGVDAAGAETLTLTGLAAGTYYLRVWGIAAVTYTGLITPN